MTEEGVMVQGVWDLAEGSHYTIDLPSFVLGLGLALGLGGGGGVASERARVWCIPDRLLTSSARFSTNVRV